MTNWKPRASHWKDKPSPEAIVFWSTLVGLVAGFAASWLGYWLA